MHVLLRTDASAAIGTGHLSRCLALADWLCARGHEAHFACRAGPDPGALRGHAVTWLAGSGAPEPDRPEARWLEGGWEADAGAVRPLAASADLVVRDHYALDARWDHAVAARRLLVIDELADRPHAADALLDAACLDPAGARYAALLPTDASRFLGPTHAIVRPALWHAAHARQRRAQPECPRLLLFMGGVDASGEAARIARLLAPLVDLTDGIDVVPGLLTPSIAAAPGIAVHSSPCNYDALLAAADAAIGAGGTSLWERALLGLPSLALSVAANQRRVVTEAATAGITVDLGDATAIGDAALARALSRFLADRPARARQAAACVSLMGARIIEGDAVSVALARWIER